MRRQSPYRRPFRAGRFLDPIISNLYNAEQEDEVPDTAVKASLGCSNPTALAELKAREIVLDLGSGGVIYVLLFARRVGPTGKAIRSRGRESFRRGKMTKVAKRSGPLRRYAVFLDLLSRTQFFYFSKTNCSRRRPFRIRSDTVESNTVTGTCIRRENPLLKPQPEKLREAFV